MSPDIIDWARRHAIPPAALIELRNMLGVDAAPPPPDSPAPQSEAWVSNAVRLEAARVGVYLFRNNVGSLPDKFGRWVRYGLANDSKAMNERIKSGDLIGFRPVAIQPEHVGRVIAQFVSRECKAAGWRWAGTDREQAQARWAELVTVNGGDAKFTTGVL